MHDEEIKLGVLALQGGFAKHLQVLHDLGYHAQLIRYPHELETCHGLILPGGESTTIYLQAQRMGFLEALSSFSTRGSIFGTCAGTILMAKLGLLNISIERNAYGRQIDSFCETFLFQNHPIPALFIRAPIIREIGIGVEVLIRHQGLPVLVKQHHHIAATFHPELTEDASIHKYWISLVKQNDSQLCTHK